LGGGALVAGQLNSLQSLLERAEAGDLLPRERYELAKAERQLHSVCIQCNTGCGIKAKILDGICVKIDGNPYSPWTLTPHLPYATSPFESSLVEGTLCPKGQAGIQSAYDPYRLVKVLKRAGPRGSNRWRTISFDQAIDEIVNGGLLFKDVSREEQRSVEGLKDLYALRDPKVAKAMAEEVKHIEHEKDQAKKRALVEAFKAMFKDHLHTLIDPDHPDLGPKNNQFCFVHGRVKGGRGELIKDRFTKDAFGSVNAHGHTTVCQGSLYFTGKAMSEQWDYDEKDKKAKWTGGKKFYWQADTGGSEFLIFVGASPFEANYGPPLRAGKITDGLVEGRLKIAVVDPRLSKTAAKAWKWIPAEPGTEGALALAMIRWIIEQKRFDARYLENANKAAAKEDAEPTWTNAVWLVKMEKDGQQPGALLRAADLGLEAKIAKTAKDGTAYDYDAFVTFQSGQPVAFDPNDEATPVYGELLVDTEMNGIKVKSAFQLLWESASEHTLEKWAEICGIRSRDIIDLAREFTSHGKHAAADIHRGVSQHTNGFYNVFAWYALNLLIGNFDWRGGMIQASTYDIVGEKEGKPYNLKKLHPGKTTAFGVDVIRGGKKYEESTLFTGYPAKRPWFPLASDVYQEIIPSIGDAYPYPMKIVLLYMGTPAYALPAGQTNIEILADVNKVPLFIASDILIGGTSMYADYIFPDLSPLERWEFQGSHPSVPQKVQPVRQPVIAPIPERVKVFGIEMPISVEAMILAFAQALKLPGFGPGGFGEGMDLKRPADYYLKMVANVAAGDKPGDEVPDADSREADLFFASRRHLPKTVFDPAAWSQAAGEGWWKKAIYVLNRGGRFQDYAKTYDGERVKNTYGKLISLYSEKAAKTKNPMTGKPFLGIAKHLPLADVLGRPIAEDGFDLRLITYREIMQTKERTMSNYWLLSLLPENFLLMNAQDAQQRRLRSGDRVKVTSASNPEGVWDLKNGTKVPMVGKVKLTQGMRPGVVAFCLGFGHWACGGQDVVVDGERIRGDPRRVTGLHANAAMAIDPYLKNTCLEDVVGGSVSFYDSQVSLVKV
jgi:anaerobic selenocysteine-containing dehydrogenase